MNAEIAIDVAWDQIQGRRFSQQDRVACVRIGTFQHLLVLADGVGGRVGGDVASTLAVSSFCSAYQGVSISDEPNRCMRTALRAANFAIRERTAAIPELSGMGTTLTAATLNGPQLHWISVGDSPLWLFRQRTMRLLNAKDLSFHAISGQNRISFATCTKPEQLWIGDILLLASDGVKTCCVDELSDIVGASTSSAAATVDRILAAVQAHADDYQDNATVIVLRVIG